MKIYFNLMAVLMASLLLFSCCDNDYIIGGEANKTNKVDKSTFDLLNQMEETKLVAQLF